MAIVRESIGAYGMAWITPNDVHNAATAHPKLHAASGAVARLEAAGRNMRLSPRLPPRAGCCRIGYSLITCPPAPPRVFRFVSGS